MATQPLKAQGGLNAAKYALGRELEMLEGFAGIGLGANEVRVYVLGSNTPVARYLQNNYGNYYRGYGIRLIPTPGFRALSEG